MRIRLILDLEGTNGYRQMAIDEAMLILRSQNRIPDTLRLWRFRPSAISIGYFQSLYKVVNVELAKAMGVDIVRRFTGGGAVYHEYGGELTYTVTLQIRGELADIQKSYEILCRGIVEAVRMFGLNAEFKPINDVIIHGKKVSGGAQARRGSALLQHGTLMYATNLDTLAKLLTPPREKLQAHGITDIRQRVTTLSLELQRPVDLDEVVDAVVNGFRKALGAELYEDSYTEAELRLAEELEPKYRSHEWIYRR